jgi:hypothetical protein
MDEDQGRGLFTDIVIREVEHDPDELFAWCRSSSSER